MKVEVLAPAKVNLALHVTGQRGDGYHFLDTLVGFGPAFDRLTIQISESLVLAVEGPEASGVPTDASNLILKAARVLDANRGGSFKLQKFLGPKVPDDIVFDPGKFFWRRVWFPCRCRWR